MQEYTSVLKSIDELTEFNVISYDRTETNDERFYLMEQSSLQVLREFPPHLSIHVQQIFSQRHRIAQRVEKIKSCSTVQEFFDMVVPLVENGSFPCDTLTIIIDNKLCLKAHDDGEVELTSKSLDFLLGLVKMILSHQGFNPSLVDDIIKMPNLYLKLERPNIIRASFNTFEELLDNL